MKTHAGISTGIRGEAWAVGEATTLGALFSCFAGGSAVSAVFGIGLQIDASPTANHLFPKAGTLAVFAVLASRTSGAAGSAVGFVCQ